MCPSAKTVTIFTDNSNTVDIFNTLSALPTYNSILKSSVDVIISHNLNVHILHIPGKDNAVADALSCQNFISAKHLCPSLMVNSFQPPQNVLGSLKK
jgi:hypothetical protein